MLLDDVWAFMEREVFSLPSNARLFNPYGRACAKLDVEGATEIRRQNLKSYLASFSSRPSVLVLGEAPGPHGCRFSGVPFTCEEQLLRLTAQDCEERECLPPFHGQGSSVGPAPQREGSGIVFWRTMRRYHPSFIVWNCVPLHPHLPTPSCGDSHGCDVTQLLSVRNPTAGEVKSYSGQLAEFCGLINPEKIVAIGRKAEYALALIGSRWPYSYVRHPSHGGIVAFTEGMRAELSLYEGQARA